MHRLAMAAMRFVYTVSSLSCSAAPTHLPCCVFQQGGGSSESTFRLAKFLYESGDYVTSAAILKEYLKCGGGDTLGALWGKFAADIMAGSWDDANQARMDLGVAMDRSSSPKHVTQQQRAWALHWSLFVCFHKSGGLDHLLEFFLQDSCVFAWPVFVFDVVHARGAAVTGTVK